MGRRHGPLQLRDFWCAASPNPYIIHEIFAVSGQQLQTSSYKNCVFMHSFYRMRAATGFNIQNTCMLPTNFMCVSRVTRGPGQLSRYSDSLQSGDRIRAGARFSAPVQTGCGSHPTSYTMGTGSFPGVKWPGRGVDHPPHLVVRLKK